MLDSIIEAREATVSFDDQCVISNLTMVVERGDIVVLKGPNGSGKTTALRLMSGVVAPSDGSVRVLGEQAPVSPNTRAQVRASLDEPVVWPWMTARRSLSTIAGLAGYGDDLVSDALDMVGLGEAESRWGRMQQKRVGKFSQGMRKRLQVAAALVVPAQLYLLDEPTSTLDPAGRDIIWDALRAVAAGGGTVVTASHEDADEIREAVPAARIFEVKNGVFCEGATTTV